MERNQKTIFVLFFHPSRWLSNCFKKKKKKEFTVRGKLSLIGYYCIYYIIKKRRAIIFFLPASCIYWKRPVLRSSEECSVFEAWFLSVEEEARYRRSDTNVSALPVLVRYSQTSSWRRTKQFKCSWPQKTFTEKKKKRQKMITYSCFWRKKKKERKKNIRLLSVYSTLVLIACMYPKCENKEEEQQKNLYRIILANLFFSSFWKKR